MKINSVIKLLLFALSLILFGLFLFHGCSHLHSKYQRVLKDGKRTTGIVVSSGKKVSLAFEVNGKKYRTISTQSSGDIYSLECFEVVYDSLDPSISYPLLYRPITLFESNYERTQSIEVIDIMGGSNVQFYYNVNNKTLSSYAEVPPSFMEVDIDETKNYLVKYHKDKPHIAYIYLDSVISSK